MNSQSKHTFLVWSVVILAVMNVSTLATILYHQYQSSKSSNVSQTQNQLEADAQKFSGRYFRDKLNFDSRQMKQFRSFNPEFRQQARAITVELVELRKQMLVEMAAQVSDTNNLNALSDTIGRLHSNLKKLTFRYYVDMKNICDVEQQIQLKQLFEAMFTNDQSMGFPGRGNGGGGGQQHGKRKN